MTSVRSQTRDVGPVVVLLAVLIGATAAMGALSGLYAEELGSARVVVWLAPIVGLGRVLQTMMTARHQSPAPATVVAPGGRSAATGVLVGMSLVYVVVLGGLVVLLARYSGGLGLGRTMRSVVIALIVAIWSALMLAFMLRIVARWRPSPT